MGKWIIFDIETAPLPEEQLADLMPPFCVDDVKTGNLKDPEKIEAKIKQAMQDHRDKFFANAALSAATGRVLVIGYHLLETEAFLTIDEGEERLTLENFWRVASQHKQFDCWYAGVNIFGFDLPFLVRRSWILGVDVPNWVGDFAGHYPRWHPMFVDLRQVWQLGDRQCESSFDHIGQTLGTGGKTAGDNGANFARLYESDRDAAMAYLRNDVEQPAKWIKQMGLDRRR